MTSQKNNFVILISPLNTLYTYNFEFIKRSNYSKYFNLLFNEKKSDVKLEILPYIEENVLKRNIEEKLIEYFFYYANDDNEKQMIEKEHEFLGLDKYLKPKFILKNELLSLKDKYILFISENYAEDFVRIEKYGNVIRILNWMLYKKTNDYLDHQKETFKYIEYDTKTKTNNCELIIECLRQCNILIKFCFDNLSLINSPNKFREYIIDNFITKGLKCLNILDHNSTSKLYRKRELAQASPLVYHIPFLHHFIPLKDENDFDKYYSDVKVILQRNPYFYYANEELYKTNFQAIFDKKESIVQLHSISVIDTLFNRHLVYELLYNFVTGIKDTLKQSNINLEVPYSFKYILEEKLSSNENLNNLKNVLKIDKKMEYPFMIKPISCTHHEMKLILNEEGLNNIFNDEKIYKDFILNCKEFIVQKYINHGGEMIKTFCINGESYEFIRPSTPNLDKNSVDKVSKSGECTLYNELIYQRKKNNFMGELIGNTENTVKILEEKFNIVKKITLLFLEKTKITLFGLDYLYDSINDTFYILEINYFPSYRELGNKINSKFDEHVITFYNKYKK
jgi:hypothetical protein